MSQAFFLGFFELRRGFLTRNFLDQLAAGRNTALDDQHAHISHM
jgi:hypothetical protein